MQKIKNIILCGGNGTRLWPLSRKMMPKQFYKLINGKTSLFQETVMRNSHFTSSVEVVTNEEQYFIACDQVAEISLQGAFSCVVEGKGRNTAAAIALSCLGTDLDEVVLVTPSDHIISNPLNYYAAVKKATDLAKSGNIVVFGVKPEYPETGFGYIESDGCENVVSFKEKPNHETATRYVESENFFWNAGIFCFTVGTMLSELAKHAPDTLSSAKAAYSCKVINGNTTKISAQDMMMIPNESIDYAVIEQSDVVKVVACDMGWSDVGSFDALGETLNKDENNNGVSNATEHISIDSNGNTIFSEGKTIATVGVDDLIIVDTPDALLITRKGMSQGVKEVVSKLQERKSSLFQVHVTVHRPWGNYTVLEDSPTYKIKRIVVHPGKSLSLQKHYHRNEHWTVVGGTAIIQIGEKETQVRPNEATYINMGEIHRLTNPGRIDLVLIETQVGSYLGEDDIIRLEDNYGRVS